MDERDRAAHLTEASNVADPARWTRAVLTSSVPPGAFVPHAVTFARAELDALVAVVVEALRLSNTPGVINTTRDLDKALYDLDQLQRAPTCQFCLADPRHTPLGPAGNPRCPVCGAAYSGPRRGREYQTLLEAGLVTQDNKNG